MTVIRCFLILLILMAGVPATFGTALAASPRVLQASTAAPALLRRPPAQQPPPQTYPEMRIAAVVNDDVISVADLDFADSHGHAVDRHPRFA